LAAVLLAAVPAVRAWLMPQTRERLAQQYGDQIAAFSEEPAARLVARLAADGDQWLDVLLAATLDSRPLIARAAEHELSDRLLQWATLPAKESSPRAAMLGRALAQRAPAIPPEQRAFSRRLALQLVDWPIDGRVIEAGAFIADCQAVLLLPVAEPVEVRVASMLRSDQDLQQVPEPDPMQPQLVLEAPAQVLSVDPIPAPAANAESTNEPSRFVPGKSQRISDE